MRTERTAPLLAAVLVVAGGVPSLAQEQATTTDSSDLDLREANVVGVELDRADDAGSYDFSVTLYHDDDGEPGYANWWQVETLNGTELGRRDLLHAHGTRPFTRSERIEVPANVSLVVVRGHDQTHGYGGQAMVVDLGTNSTQAIQQGPTARDFGDCTAVRGETRDETTTAPSETDLVDCPWEANATAQTTA